MKRINLILVTFFWIGLLSVPNNSKAGIWIAGKIFDVNEGGDETVRIGCTGSQGKCMQISSGSVKTYYENGQVYKEYRIEDYLIEECGENCKLVTLIGAIEI